MIELLPESKAQSWRTFVDDSIRRVSVKDGRLHRENSWRL